MKLINLQQKQDEKLKKAIDDIINSLSFHITSYNIEKGNNTFPYSIIT